MPKHNITEYAVAEIERLNRPNKSGGSKIGIALKTKSRFPNRDNKGVCLFSVGSRSLTILIAIVLLDDLGEPAHKPRIGFCLLL